LEILDLRLLLAHKVDQTDLLALRRPGIADQLRITSSRRLEERVGKDLALRWLGGRSRIAGR
jgi:hypothetical protein